MYLTGIFYSNKKKNIGYFFKNPWKFVQHRNYTTTQIFSKIRNHRNADSTFVLSRVVWYDIYNKLYNVV